jgi:2-C-methyl-D-erythritol 4-phosphate cytidylyltransferase/2-C-methyl-D-erythritol 2,4-cyclodiphosphate synthase
MTARDLAVIVVAAGRGERLGANTPKAFVEIIGRTILEYSLIPLQNMDALAQVIVAAPATHREAALDIADSVLGHSGNRIDVVVGGETRQQSIANALAVIDSAAEVVLVHDAARAFATTKLFDRVADAVRETRSACIPALEIADTIKRVEGDLVLDTVDRSTLRAAQTPQGFVASELVAAYREAGADFTDDAALMQSLGHKVLFVAGEASAEKITTGSDLARVVSRLSSGTRTGIGVDVHRFSTDASKPLYLGTIEWPGVPGLDGHSDGDAVSHAIVDALLSAAGLGDIGSNFGVDRPEFAGANGSVFLTETVALLEDAGFRPLNVSVQVIGNRPKISTQREAAERALSELIGAPVSFGATTTDGLGFLGNDEGVAAVASALIIDSEARLTS